MDIVAALGRTIPFAFASGINLYATIAVMGLSSRFGLVDLPEQFRAFEHPAVIAGAIALYAIEFFADKIPWVDSLWDAVHTIVRPVGGAIVAVTALGHATPAIAGPRRVDGRLRRADHAPDQGRHPCGREHQSGAIQQLAAQHGRGHLRDRFFVRRVEPPDPGVDGVPGAAGGDCAVRVGTDPGGSSSAGGATSTAGLGAFGVRRSTSAVRSGDRVLRASRVVPITCGHEITKPILWPSSKFGVFRALVANVRHVHTSFCVRCSEELRQLPSRIARHVSISKVTAPIASRV